MHKIVKKNLVRTIVIVVVYCGSMCVV